MRWKLSAISIGTHGFFLRESELSKTQSCIKTGKCNKIVSKISRSWTEWFLSWKDEGDKTYLIATEVRSMLFVTNRCGAPKALLFFDQSEKSLDSGLRADDALSKCIGRPFLLVGKQKRILATNFYNLQPVINPVTIQRRLNWTKLMNKESACMLSEKPEASDKHFRLFLEKWKTNCNQLFGDSIGTFFFLLDEICWTQHSYNS